MERQSVVLGELRLGLAEESVVDFPEKPYPSRFRRTNLMASNGSDAYGEPCERPEGAEDEPQLPGTRPPGRHGKGPMKSSSSSRHAFISSHSLYPNQSSYCGTRTTAGTAITLVPFCISA